MTSSFLRLLPAAALVLGLGVNSLGDARAGVVTGAWDPLFGPYLPDLSWSGQTEFWVPDACVALGDGVHSVGAGPCSGTTVNFANVKFFDLATDPVGSQIIDFQPLGLAATDVKVQNNQVVAVATSLAIGGNPSSAPAAQGNLFGLQFSLTSPVLVCIFCSPTGPDINNGNVTASVNGMEQTFYTYDNNGDPKLVDWQGKPVGVILDSQGNWIDYTSVPVPEPGTWALMTGGLMALGLLRRRRR